MKKAQKKEIVNKAIELGLVFDGNGYVYDLPLGLKNRLSFEEGDLELGIIMADHYVSIRKVESPEDLEMLFDAIVPVKFRLPW